MPIYALDRDNDDDDDEEEVATKNDTAIGFLDRTIV